MITKFDTTKGSGTGTPAPAAPSTGGSDNTLLYLGLFAIGAYVAYKYVYVPYAEKLEAEKS